MVGDNNEDDEYGDEEYEEEPLNGEGYEEVLSGTRQSSSIGGSINRQARMLAQQNYRMSQGQSRKSNQRSIYIDTPNNGAQ